MADNDSGACPLVIDGKIPDLWGNEINVDTLTPVMILNAQAELLRKKTQGVVMAEVSSRQSRGIVTLSLDLSAPAVHGFRERIVGVRHHLNRVYPAFVMGPNNHAPASTIP